jgi:hypothetical protein
MWYLGSFVRLSELESSAKMRSPKRFLSQKVEPRLAIEVDTLSFRVVFGNLRGTGPKRPGCWNDHAGSNIRLNASGNHPTHPGRWNAAWLFTSRFCSQRRFLRTPFFLSYPLLPSRV